MSACCLLDNSKEKKEKKEKKQKKIEGRIV